MIIFHQTSVSNEVFSTIRYLFYNSLEEGVFKDKIKVAYATPIFKNGDKSLLINDRPISVLPCFSKKSIAKKTLGICDKKGDPTREAARIPGYSLCRTRNVRAC